MKNISKKIMKFTCVLLLAFCFNIIGVNAEDVSTAEELKTALETGGDVKLVGNITTNETIEVTKDGSLDLAGKTLTYNGNGGFIYVTGTSNETISFEALDSVGNGKLVFESSNSANVNAFVVSYADFEFKSGSIESNRSAIWAKNDSNVVVSGGKIKALWYAVGANGTVDPTKPNYGNNAKITVTGGELISDEDYVIYMPSKDGKLTVSGGTMVTEGLAGAIAINRGDVKISGGTFISGGVDVGAGDTNDGTNNFKAAVINVAAKYGDVTLEITDGVFKAPQGGSMFASGSYSITNYDGTADISIKGGHFSQIPEVDVETGYAVYYNTADNTYDVSKSETLELTSETIVLTVGDTSDKIHKNTASLVGLSLDYIEYGELTEEEYNYYNEMVELDPETGTVTAVNPGTGYFKVWMGTGSDIQEKNLTIIVIPKATVVAGDDEIEAEEVVSDANVETLNNELAETIKELLDTDDDDLDELGLAVKEAILGGSVISAQITTDLVDEDDLDEDIISELEKTIDDNTKVAAYYEVTIDVLIDGTEVGNLDEIENALTITLPIPDGLPEVPKGKTRIFKVIRVHGDDNNTEELAVTDNGNGTVSFASDKYSTFALTYQDVDTSALDDTPNTGSVIATIGIVMMVASAGALIVIRSRKYLA